MQQTEFDFDSVPVNRIRSYYRTLERYLRTAMTAHNRLTPGCIPLAQALENNVDAIVANHPGRQEVARWAGKFYALMQRYDIPINASDELIGGKHDEEEGTLQPATRPNVRETESGRKDSRLD